MRFFVVLWEGEGAKGEGSAGLGARAREPRWRKAQLEDQKKKTLRQTNLAARSTSSARRRSPEVQVRAGRCIQKIEGGEVGPTSLPPTVLEASKFTRSNPFFNNLLTERRSKARK